MRPQILGRVRTPKQDRDNVIKLIVLFVKASNHTPGKTARLTLGGMFESCAPLEPILFTSAREMFCASPGVTTGSGTIWIGRSLGSRSALTACRLEVPWTFFASFVSAMRRPGGQRLGTVVCERQSSKHRLPAEPPTGGPAGIFHCRKSIGPRLRLSAGVLRRMDKLLISKSVGSVEIRPDPRPGTRHRGTRDAFPSRWRDLSFTCRPKLERSISKISKDSLPEAL